MDVRFLLGPAGSGKTWRCLEEIRTRLKAAPEGPPLILLAPKQATFQLERQLLADEDLGGYSRLRILSFERLASWVLEELGVAPPPLLSEEGRVMLLRARLSAHRGELKIFRASSRLPGFARQLSGMLRELQQHRLGAARLRELAGQVGPAHRLDEKLHDLALLMESYRERIEAHGLQDGERLLDLAAEALQERDRQGQRTGSLGVEALWMDGFAQMTPQERHLLRALLPHCGEATLAFCLEAEPTGPLAWYSPWTLLAESYRQCRQEIEGARSAGLRTRVEVLGREAHRGRFAGNEVLRHVERHWARPRAMVSPPPGEPAVRLVECGDPEAELVAAARIIRRFVREGGRYREVAVLVRQLEAYHGEARRVLGRYEIPFFLDRRERVAHHPLAELTRCAVRTLAFHWRHEDWFGALKSGLVRVGDGQLDWLENLALEHGWEGQAWQRPLKVRHRSEQQQEAVNRLRTILLRPFATLARTLGGKPRGEELASGLRRLWDELEVGQTLEAWSDSGAQDDPAGGEAVHATVWEQMQEWLENLSLAFAGESMTLPEWLPILETGLEGLTVGVIPSVLDQVLVGAIDRSRNPDLRRVIILGMNERVFPAPPPSPVLLTERDRERLEDAGHALGPVSRQQLGHERFYGYIACTRAREQVVCTYARQDANGQVLNPSGFLRHLRRLLPWLVPEVISGRGELAATEHASELVADVLEHAAGPPASRDPRWERLSLLSPFAPVLERLRHLQPAGRELPLDAGLALDLHGPRLRTSISRMERFGHCPFRFFVESGLRVEERKRFQLDLRQQGSFQHEVLRRFHEELGEEKLRWRDLTVEAARQRVGRIAEALIPSFEGGLMQARGHHRFLAEYFKASLQQFVGVVIDWMDQYEFDPVKVELGFGGPHDSLPAWEVSLEGGRQLALRGRIDRVDTWRDPGTGTLWCVVVDYKLGGRKPDRQFMEHGLEQQLPAYLNVLRHLRDPAEEFGAGSLEPAGVFFVALRDTFEVGSTRSEVVGHAEEALKQAYKHLGMFDRELLPHLDNRPGATVGDQFPYRLKRDGTPDARTFGCLSRESFRGLLAHQERLLIDFGNRIYAGDVAVDPWKKGQRTACERCDFSSICRIDPWVHSWRILPSGRGTSGPSAAGTGKSATGKKGGR